MIQANSGFVSPYISEEGSDAQGSLQFVLRSRAREIGAPHVLGQPVQRRLWPNGATAHLCA
eukprot:scaffold33999_cov69-Phaeocystis_antarctica.AAC.4